MQIVLNGESTPIADGISVAALIESLQLSGQKLAVELNGDIVPRSQWFQVRFQDGDRAEIVKAIGGG